MSQKFTFLIMLVALLHEIDALGIGTGIVEVSPLRAVLGTPEFKLEVPVFENLNGSFGYQDLTVSSGQETPEGRVTAFEASVFFHSNVYFPAGVFLGPGFIWEESSSYQTQKSASRTWERQNSLETEDRWKIRRKALKINQTLGYRANFGEYTTGSIRVQLNKVVYASHRIEKIAIHSDEVEEVSVESPTWGKTIAFYWGINIP